MQQGGSGTDQYFDQSGASTYGTTAVSSAVVAANTSYNFGARGVIVPSAGGSLQLKARTEVDTSTITVLKRGWGQLTDLGLAPA